MGRPGQAGFGHAAADRTGHCYFGERKKEKDISVKRRLQNCRGEGRRVWGAGHFFVAWRYRNMRYSHAGGREDTMGVVFKVAGSPLATRPGFPANRKASAR